MKNRRIVMFAVDDRVWNIDFGWGTIVSIHTRDWESHFPIQVRFDCGDTYRFTLYGAAILERNRSLFFEEIKITESALKRPRWRANGIECYYYVTSIGEVDYSCDARTDITNSHFEVGNYFETKELAKASKFYKAFHEVE